MTGEGNGDKNLSAYILEVKGEESFDFKFCFFLLAGCLKQKWARSSMVIAYNGQKDGRNDEGTMLKKKSPTSIYFKQYLSKIYQ